MSKKEVEWKFSKLLMEKIVEHDAIVKCPYCKQHFDIHTGLIFVEGKQVPNVPQGYGYTHFEDIMKRKKKP